MHSPGAQGRIAPVDLFISRYTALPTRIRFDDAGIHGRSFAFGLRPSSDAALHWITAKQIAAPKTAVSIFGKK